MHAWDTLILGLSQPERRNNLSIVVPIHPGINGLIGLCVQAFFARRIWILKWNWLDVAVSYTIVVFGIVGQRVDQFDVLRPWAFLHLGGSLLCDAIITVFMFIKLRWYKKRISVPAVQTMIRSLSIITVENGLVITVFVALNLSLYASRPHVVIHIAFHWMSGRLYANVLLAAVNNTRILEYKHPHSTIPAADSRAFQFMGVGLAPVAKDPECAEPNPVEHSSSTLPND
ncbi:hypothetical protein FA15DRAFT_654665 [Coprinopsis marcescibilis]|nr:hypothetical protein FA15DRAFT_654665 [Coprinopsis marcescibilis]